jgi:kynureninase
VVVLTEVDFRSGRRHDMAAVTARAQAAGALVVWDLAHSAGAFPVALDRCGVDFAVGCTYKYLNAGPGGPAFLYAAARHHAASQQPLAGWIGHADPFAMTPDYVPAPGIVRFLTGTPPVLALAPLEASLDVWEQVDMAAVRAKSVALTELFIELVAALPTAYGLTLASPSDPGERGSQVALRHPDGAYRIMKALIEARVVGDFRAPDILRFGFTPLTLRYVDVVEAVRRLDVIMRAGHWRGLTDSRGSAVT